MRSSCLAILASYRQQRRAAARPCFAPLWSRLRSWPPHMGPVWAALSSGRAGLPGGDAGAGGRSGRDHGFTRRREVPMKRGHFLPEPSGRVSGAVFRQRPSRATAVVRQADSVAGQALGIGRPVGPESQESQPPARAVFRGAEFRKQCHRLAITIS